jgi:hypothetical protein
MALHVLSECEDLDTQDCGAAVFILCNLVTMKTPNVSILLVFHSILLY